MNMKKNVIVIVLFCCGFLSNVGLKVQAQYTIDIDTIRGRHSHYIYQFWDDSAALCHHDSMDCYRVVTGHGTGYDVDMGTVSLGLGWCLDSSYFCPPPHYGGNPALAEYGWPSVRESAAGFYVDTAVRIIGLAVVPYKIGTWKMPLPELRLYKPTGTSVMNLIASSSFDTNDYQHIMFIEAFGSTFQTPDSIYYKVYELYFDSAITMTDSFYVSWVHNDNRNLNGNGFYSPVIMHEFVWNVITVPTPHCPFRYPQQHYKAKTLDSPDAPWRDYNASMVAFMMPILQYDGDTCMPVSGLQWHRWNADGAWVQWDTEQWQNHWQLSYGPEGTPAGAGTIIECDGHTKVLYGLDTTARYSLYVRARCNELPQRPWTAWSSLTMDMTKGGIDGATMPGLSVTPNPTSGRFAVHCTEAMTGLEVYSLQGHLVLTQSGSGCDADIDMGCLPAGTYMLSVKTAHGSACRTVVKK